MMKTLEAGLTEFDSKGYLIIKHFFNPTLIELFKNDFLKAIAQNDKAITDVDIALLKWIEESVKPIMQSMHLKTDLKPIDIIRGAGYFSIGHRVNFPWHQDSRSYYLLQDAYHYLNLYIPIIKPEPHLSNLSIISFDALRSHSPILHEILKGRGSTAAIVKESNTEIVDTNTDRLLGHIDGDINEIAITPHLSAGDLLMMRGDLLHKTQDNYTNRVALSIRLIHSGSVIQKQKLLECGWYKMRMLLKNSKLFLAYMDCFEEAGKDELTVKEMMAYLTKQGLDGFRHDPL